MIGKIAIYIVLSLAGLSTLFYFLGARKEKNIKLAEYLYFAVSAGLVFVSAFLLSNILSYNFQFTYIWEYSSRELPLGLLVTSFYSGQEGSFLLWALMLALVGLILQPYTKRIGYQPLVMGFYSLILVFVLIMLIAKSPFNYVWESFPDAGMSAGFTPPNGRGLNPILQNYWNAIHPPILFIGYAAMSVPFVFAVAGLIKREYNNWINVSIAWTLASTATLGLGIMLGGFWAYETLGWGGFWGWDPVENSSLLPWLVAVALVHTMLVQKRTGGLVRTNFILAIIAFLLVLYATFLTRSGILGEISVHSFGEPGQFVYVLLLAFLITFFVLGFGALIFRMKDISSQASKMDFKPSSREFLLSLGSIVILAITTIVFLGTSWPILGDIMGTAKASVDISFYDKWNLPFAVMILLFNAFSLYLNWKSSDMKGIANRIAISVVIAIALTLVAFFNGVNNVMYLLLAFASFYSISVNVEFVIRQWRAGKAFFGAYLSHFGVSLLLLGALISGGYAETQHLTLTKGKSVEAMGYKLTFKDVNQIEKQYQDREKYEYIITAEKDGRTTTLKPIFYWSDFNQRQAPFLEPGINERLLSDLYISPKSAETEMNYPLLLLTKNETSRIPLDTSITMTVLGFDMTHGMELSQENRVSLGVAVEFKNNATSLSYEDTLYSNIDIQTKQGIPISKTIQGTKIIVGFSELVAGGETGSQAAFIFHKEGEPIPEPTEVFAFDFAIKPLINFVWIGTIFIVIGFFWGIPRHVREYKRKAQAND